MLKTNAFWIFLREFKLPKKVAVIFVDNSWNTYSPHFAIRMNLRVGANSSAYGAGGLQPPLSEKNCIIRAKLKYRSGKDTVRWDTCCSERQLTTDGKRPLSYHSLLHMYWQSRQWTSIKVWGQWPGGFVRIGWNRIQPFSKHQQHPNCVKFLWRG